MDESALIARALHGDPQAWDPLILANQDSVFRLAYLLLGDPDEAEDVAQETFLRAWTSLGRFDATRPLRPWLLSIAANLARNRRRSAGRYFAALTRAFRNEEQTPASVEEKHAEQTDSGELWRAVQGLSVPDQQVVYLRYFLELSVAETAAVLQVAEGTVKSRLNRAVERLRIMVERDFPLLSEGHEA